MKRRNLISGTAALLLLTACAGGRATLAETPSPSDLHFDRLAASWDEGLPLGNATVGQLVWQRDSTLRFSLDRVDLWDLRPMDSLSGPNYRFAWVREQAEKNDYLPVQKKFDHPYDAQAAPAKIPGAALEFSKWINQGDHRYMCLAECPQDGKLLLRIKFKHTAEGYSAGRLAYRADESMQSFYAAKSSQPRSRGRSRRRRKKLNNI